MNSDVRSQESSPSASSNRCISRRELLKCTGSCIGAAALFSLVGSVNSFSEDRDADVLPHAGDVFVFFTGPQKGSVVSLKDLVVDAAPVLVRAKDPASGVVRHDKGNRSLILLLRVNPESIPPELQESSAQGALAYSAMCTHLGCLVENWDAEKKQLQCPCHKSAYDPVQGAKVIFGPAPRPLPLLPLKLQEDLLVVAGEFSARVGPQKS